MLLLEPACEPPSVTFNINRNDDKGADNILCTDNGVLIWRLGRCFLVPYANVRHIELEEFVEFTAEPPPCQAAA